MKKDMKRIDKEERERERQRERERESETGAVFRTLYLLHNLQIGPIS